MSRRKYRELKMINIDDLLGVRYKRNGRTKEKGFDCYGLAIEVLKRMGKNFPDIEYARRDDYKFDEAERLILKKVNLEQTETPKDAGDIVLISRIRGPAVHIGVYLGNGQIIHCNEDCVHVEQYISLKPFIRRVYKWI